MGSEIKLLDLEEMPMTLKEIELAIRIIEDSNEENKAEAIEILEQRKNRKNLGSKF